MEVLPCVSKLWWQSWTLLCKNTSGQRRGQNNFWSSISRTLIWVRGQEFLCQVLCMIIYMREKGSERWDHGNLTSKGPVWTGRVTDLGTEEDKCSSLPWGSQPFGAAFTQLPRELPPCHHHTVLAASDRLLFFQSTFHSKCQEMKEKFCSAWNFWKYEEKTKYSVNRIVVLFCWMIQT